MNVKAERLQKELTEKHPTFRGWEFEYVYPGFLAYHSPGGRYSLFFTPDFSGDEEINLQLHTDPGEVVWSHTVKYEDPLEVEELLRIVEPYITMAGELEKAAPAGGAAVAPVQVVAPGAEGIAFTFEEFLFILDALSDFAEKNRNIARPARGYLYSVLKKFAWATGAMGTEEGREVFERRWGFLDDPPGWRNHK